MCVSVCSSISFSCVCVSVCVCIWVGVCVGVCLFVGFGLCGCVWCLSVCGYVCMCHSVRYLCVQIISSTVCGYATLISTWNLTSYPAYNLSAWDSIPTLFSSCSSYQKIPIIRMSCFCLLCCIIVGFTTILPGYLG